jgi:hypothetical protein
VIAVAQQVASNTANASVGTTSEDMRERVTEIHINNTDYRTTKRSGTLIAAFIHFVLIFNAVFLDGF